jgi:hypothetical protein
MLPAMVVAAGAVANVAGGVPLSMETAAGVAVTPAAPLCLLPEPQPARSMAHRNEESTIIKLVFPRM